MDFSDLVALKVKELMEEKHISMYKLRIKLSNLEC